MIAHADLIHVLALVNASILATLTLGYVCIRRGSRDGHRRVMSIAIALGCGFLAIYFYYHFSAGVAKFGGQGMIRPVYFSLLTVHTLMAAIAGLLIPAAFLHAIAGHFVQHQRLARWALPIWLFVAASGLAVYAMAVHLFPIAVS
ncbi:DUF420 domain-containing protein [Bradyrhizobium sp.]|uniref:DUF420 domain-containing protein n=1 Tax=Bradyrhizobium sp. TaxID=376 RepID=UPI001DA09A38|nr:DUF420 domain-containing protein [Bradyrhizobium sp.]MBI5320034.1 DUF420 domain-containing protein [Bradyrhizobium sp.]